MKMKGIVRDALLVGCTAAVVWVAKGNAQDETPPVLYAHPIAIKCGTTDLRNAMITQSTNGYDILVRYIDGLGSYYQGTTTLRNCAIYPEVTPPSS